MFTEVDGASDRARGDNLANAAEALLAEARLDTIDVTHAVQLATASAVLALYWELRTRRPFVPPVVRPETPQRHQRAQLATEPGA